MIVAVQRFRAAVRVLEVPQADGHVGRARAEELAGGVEGQVLDEVGVALERALEVARLEVPNLDGGVLAARDDQRVDGMEDDLGDGRSVPGERELLRRSRYPVVWRRAALSCCCDAANVDAASADEAAADAGRRAGRKTESGRELLVLGRQLTLELDDLVLQAHHSGPLLLEHARLRRRRCGWCGRGRWQAALAHKCVVSVTVVVRGQVVGYGPIQLLFLTLRHDHCCLCCCYCCCCCSTVCARLIV